MNADPAAGDDAWEYETATRIHVAERDRALDLNAWTWPTSAPDGWTSHDGYLRRTIRRDQENDGKTAPTVVPVGLEELILRFPSAPLHGFQRLHEHHVMV